MNETVAETASQGGLWKVALAAAIGFAILVSLGTWQLQRLDWKRGLIAQIERRATAAPVDLDQARKLWEDGALDYRRVRLNGRFLHDREQRLYGLLKGKAGWRIITPLEVTDGSATVLVDRGFVPLERELPETRKDGQVAGDVEVIGFARGPAAGKGYFESDNEPDRRRWYWRDLAGMRNAMFADDSKREVVPFFVEQQRAGDSVQVASAVGPVGGSTRLELSNRHLEYALTWYGLAATLLAVFGAFAWKRLRVRGEHGTDASA